MPQANISLFRRTQTLKGFTQYEVLMVLAVMATLTAIAMPIYSNLTGASQVRVLSSNLHHMNMMLREAHRAGNAASANLTGLHASSSQISVNDICTAVTSDNGLYIDADGDGNHDAHELGFQMDLPPNSDPYTYLVGQHLYDDYTVKVESHQPLQLAIYKGTTLHEIP